ncbi:MAG: poly-gamma-glutamate synthase PgsB [bacterium]
MLVLLGLFLLIILAGILENKWHKDNLKKIPYIIHVNGIRGKSSTTRMIHGGLNAAGYKTIAKTTGTEPRLIYSDGQEEEIIRHGIPRIIEQARIINRLKNKDIDVLVLECMAISPEMQWISEKKLIQASITVITNVKYDHEDKMGETLEEIASTLALTIPKNGHLVTASKKFLSKFTEIAQSNNTKVHQVGNLSLELKKHFQYPVFTENVACALKVCNLFNIDHDVAIKGMSKTNTDPGSLHFFKAPSGDYNTYFINSFAANEYESTLKTWEIWEKWYDFSCYQDLPLIGIFNNRMDRSYRLKDFQKIITALDFNKLFVTGHAPIYLLKRFAFQHHDINKLNIDQIEGQLANLTAYYQSDILLFGFGNTKSQGLKIIEYFTKVGEEL